MISVSHLIKATIAWICMTLAGMRGGQKDKAWRRVGLPAIAIGAGWSFSWSWKYLAFLLFVPILCLGYGVDSQLYNWMWQIEWLTRAVYAFLLSLPFFVFGLRRGIVAGILLILAFQIHAGSLGNIGWFGDILIEDILRYGTLAGLVLFNVMKKN